MKSQKVVACALAVGLSGSLLGASYTFPSGGGDLADLAKWQVSYPELMALPGAADTVNLGSSSTFTMSSDMTVGSFSFAAKNAVLDFASSGNHTLKVMDAQHAFCAYDGTIKGGTIDRNGQAFLLSAKLPPRYSLRIDNNRDLVLVAKGEPKPMTLIFR